MDSKHDDFILTFDKLKKEFGHTPEFKLWEKTHSHDIDFLRFKKENRLRYNQKTGWNKPFIPITRLIWIKDKTNWNKGLKKYGYWQNVEAGWKLVNDPDDSKCKWCGKLLQDPRAKFCSDNDGRHRKLYHKVLKKGKELCGFDIEKNYHILIKPKLWEYEYTERGTLLEKRTNVERIEFKDIEFSIKGTRNKLTSKSRTP
jgi:hypothetical protein